MTKQPTTSKTVETFKHDDAKRKNIPSAEQQSFVQQVHAAPKQVRYPRNTDLDPQLVWRGKDEQDWSDLVVNAPPLYIQEKVHPKALIDDLMRETKEREHDAAQTTADLFSDFNGIPKGADKTEFYAHDQNWTNRMILGDSLQVMASLAEREGLRGSVQCIYFDPPYGIKFNSNFQWSTANRTVEDGKANHITREPEQVKAFRDTWRDGIHSYLTYMRDRLTVARDLLSDNGSIFVQIGDANVHRLRCLLDEVFGEDSFVSQISVRKTATPSLFLDDNHFFVLWYGKAKAKSKFRKLLRQKPLFEWVTETRGGSWGVTAADNSRPLKPEERNDPNKVPQGGRVFALSKTTSAGGAKEEQLFEFEGRRFSPGAAAHWKTTIAGMERVNKAGRLEARGGPPWFRKYHDDSPFKRMTNVWEDTSGKSTDRIYVVQTEQQVVERCILMSTDPGDLVLDPTCGSGTTATVAEQWGRRWITMDTSRVALALARARIMGARYPFYLLADSRSGQIKEGEVTRNAPSSLPTHDNIRHGFVYERVPYITLGAIANNSEIDVIWDKWQVKLLPLREQLNGMLKTNWQEWAVPREAGKDWPELAKKVHASWWEARIGRQKEIDASIAAKAEFEYLYDKPYENKKAVRVAGPFTVESLSPHRTLGVDENDELIDPLRKQDGDSAAKQSFPQMILANLKTAGVQQAHKEDRVIFTTLTPWPGDLVCAEGRYAEGDAGRRAAIFIGPEFGTVQRADLVAAAREAADAGFDVLIACAFNYEAHSTEFSHLGKLPVLKARMNADLHMAEDLKNTGKGNLFVIFGEPDIDLLTEADGQIRVKVNGVDVFKPQTGEVISNGAEGIACWFIDTDYNEESFFVRHAYFLGANDPYNSLKTTLKAEIDAEAWAMLNSDTSRPFPRPKSGRIAVKVINHLGDEVMKVFKVPQ
jgi:adenine-specific DNA-methyltransferase